MVEPSNKQRIGESTGEAIRSLQAVVKSSYGLAPVASGCLVVVALAVGALAIRWAPFMQAIVLLIVTLVALVVYLSTKSYGEAALALAAGLLSVYSVDWDTPTFISFLVVWIGFSIIALLISSIRIAATVEDIYVQASLFAPRKNEDLKALERDLRRIGKRRGRGMLGPVEKAEVIRLFAFRKLPLSVMESGLDAVETLSVVTKLEPLEVARFVADLARAAEVASEATVSGVVEFFVATVRESAVPPRDFFEGFEASRHLMFEEDVEPLELFRSLRRSLEAGVRPDRVGEYLEREFLDDEE